MQLATDVVIIITVFPIMGFLIVYKLHQELTWLISARIAKDFCEKCIDAHRIKYIPTRLEINLHITIFAAAAIIMMCIIISVNLWAIVLLSIIEFIFLMVLIIDISKNFYKELTRNIELVASKINK